MSFLIFIYPPKKCHDGLTSFDRGLAATLVACHGAMKFMESSKLMGEMSLLATSELACCKKICACLRFFVVPEVTWIPVMVRSRLLDPPLERKFLEERGMDSTAIPSCIPCI